MPVIIHISKNTLYAVWITVIVLLIWLQYTGFVLIECPPGYFGKGCRERCSGHCIRDEPCDHINGECSNGCQDGYIWSRCSECKKKIYANSLNLQYYQLWQLAWLSLCISYLYLSACTEGHYGRNCSLVCSPNCKPCRNTDGFCTCIAGWMGSNCSEGR